jgi:hypothetical protein
VKDAEPVWNNLVRKYGLEPWRLSKPTSFWHSDADLGCEIDCAANMANSRKFGFLGSQNSLESFTEVSDEQRACQFIPA